MGVESAEGGNVPCGASRQKTMRSSRRNARETQVGEARARVEQGVDAAEGEVRAVAQVDALEDAGRHGTTMADLLRLCECHDAAVCDVAALYQSDSLQFWKGC